MMRLSHDTADAKVAGRFRLSPTRSRRVAVVWCVLVTLVNTAVAFCEETHWSFRPIERPAIPAVAGYRLANPIDAFVRARLAAAGLASSPRASRRVLIRRLHLVVLGLPPTQDAVASFLSDDRPGAWERAVDRVLASPHFGERWAQHWFDIVRYAESNGFEGNALRGNAWPYRDYVIASWNADKPYARFVREQLAGDAYGADVATSYLVAGAFDGVTSPDMALTLKQRQDELADMINTTGTAFLGLTLGCARCHDHRFDPVTQEDYYSLAAVFAGVRHGEREVVGIGMTYAGKFEGPPATHVLIRGDAQQKGDPIGPGTIRKLGGARMPDDATDQRRRVLLSNWITSEENPLAARVIVNRLWQHVFGTGLVATPGDFGAVGARPTHPKLLDDLASELLAHNGSLKHLLRSLLLSETFRQDSRPMSDALDVDRGSRLLWRFPPRRLEGEAIRDAICMLSGTLDRRMGGPGFSGYDVQKKVDIDFLPKTQFQPEDFRRMVYMTRIRQEKEAVFGLFDCPDGTQIVGRRDRTTTPLQALNLSNGPFVVEQAKRMAVRLGRLADKDSSAGVDLAFTVAFGRRPMRHERQAAVVLAEEAGLWMVCRALFNANEFLMIP